MTPMRKLVVPLLCASLLAPLLPAASANALPLARPAVAADDGVTLARWGRGPGPLGIFGAIVAGTLVAAAFGCGPSIPDKIGFAGPNATLQSGTQVNFQDAWVTHDIFKVKLWVQNMSQAFMMVDRDGFALRLPEADRAGEARRACADDQHADLDPLVGRIRRLGYEFTRAERRREVAGARRH